MEINIEPGYIILRHTKGWAPTAWAIRRLTGSYFNHVGEIVVDNDNSVWMVEADPPAVKKTPIAEYVNHKKFDIKIVAMNADAFANTDEYQKAIDHSVKFLLAMVGSKYDKRAIIWLAITTIFQSIFKFGNDNPLQDRREFFCSELICESWHGTSSIIKNLFAGSKHPEATCSTITPKDIGKTVSVRFIAGKDVK